MESTWIRSKASFDHFIIVSFDIGLQFYIHQHLKLSIDQRKQRIASGSYHDSLWTTCFSSHFRPNIWIFLFSKVSTETEYGWDQKVKMSVPVFTGALGSTEIARKNWEHFAVGAAISGITIVCGENVCGIDPQLERGANGLITKAPDMDRRIETYRRYHRGYGELLVQMNVEDTRLGVAEYILDKHGIETIELKWGQGAKCIGGEIKISSLERALDLQKRGYIVTPDPSDPINQKAFQEGAIKEFERHSRLGFISEESFASEVERLRKLGFKRITLKTGAYSLKELAQALKWCSKYHIDLLTIDGASGGTGMSPWRMMEEWGIPSLYLHSAAYQFAEILTQQGERVPDLAFGGGFSSEDGVFKALALGAPYTKAVCMGRALMIPGMVGKNCAQWLKEGNLPKSISEYGSTPEEIFVSYERVKDLVGADEIGKIPLGAIGIFSYADKLKVGLQQFMAGFSLLQRSRHLPEGTDEPHRGMCQGHWHPLSYGLLS